MTINYRAWTTKQIATLRELAELKMSSTTIGDRLGVTKNAIIGQCNRSGIALLYHRDYRELEGYSRPSKVAPVARVQPPAPPPTPPDPSKAIPLLALKKHHCRQVVSARDALAMFCASPKIKAHSYCAFHAAKNFRSIES